MSENFEKIEHHAYLTTDELPFLIPLFDKGVTKITVNLRGRTTVSKNKSKISDIGIKKLSHSYLEVNIDNFVINSKNELAKLSKAYEKEGLTNVYVVNLIVEWNTGDMQEWNRAVLHVKDKDTNRVIPNGRWNALIIPMGLHSDVLKLQELYGEEFVKPTMCETVQADRGKKRVCLTVMK